MASPSLNTVLSTLKACVISNPVGVDEDCLNSEFRQLMGCSIPWRDLGFKNLQELVKTSPSLQIVIRDGRKVIIADTGGSEHLSAMIAKQKKTSSKRKRTSRVKKFFQNRMVNNNPPPRAHGGFGGTFKGAPQPVNRNESLSKKIICVEKNNNTCKKPVIQKEIHNHTNIRLGGNSSSSERKSPTVISTPRPELKSSHVNQSKKQQQPKQLSPKQSKKTLKKPIKLVMPTSQHQGEKEPNPKVEKIIEITKPKKAVHFPDEPITATVKTASSQTSSFEEARLRTKGTSPPIPLLQSIYDPDPGAITFTHHPQQKMNPILVEPATYAAPNNLTNTFIPDNLVPPKPMKSVSHYRGSKHRITARSKLMSIKDDSTPIEGSITAKFINLVKAQEWPDPEYRILPRTDASKMEVYSCTVRGSYSLDNNETLLVYHYSTIPNEYRDMNASKEAVSQKAFEDMNNKIKEAAHYVPVTSDIDEMINRIYKMAIDFPNGLWAYKIDTDYKNTYGERLPPKWEDIISDCDLLKAEKLADFCYVIRPISLPQNNLSLSMLSSGLQYPKTETWDIFVTKIISSKEVWFRFVGQNYSDWLDVETKAMCEHYSDWSKFVCPLPLVGELYVYPSSYGAVRVQVLSLDSSSHATVMHIDHGDVEQVLRSQLCVLDYTFRKLPHQAIKCAMNDLEEYSENRLCTALLTDKVEGMVLVAEIIQTEPLELTMFDTSLEDPINLNQDILNVLKSNISLPPTMSDEYPVEALVTSIWKTGEIYIQLPNEGLTYLNLQLSSLCDIPEDYYLVHPQEVMPDVLYLIEMDNGFWLRASLLPPTALLNNMVDLLLIDTGDIKTAFFYDLVPLSLISMVLCEIPKQAIKVKLSDVTIYDYTVEKLQSLVPPPCNAIIKVNSVAPSPLVELFIRQSIGFMSINSTLQLEDNLSMSLRNVSFDSQDTEYSTIKPASIPDCEEYFDVYVVSVSNPSNFTVIPLMYVNELSKLQDRLQKFYNNDDPTLKKLKNFSIGHACAVQHSDGHWYRGLIEQIIDRSMSQLMIRFCDFGNFAMISADRLYLLHKNFLMLPALGFNASLADIQPISGDWEIEDCIQSQRLMLEKYLVTIIKDKIDDKGQILLKLQVFDTSKDTDCDIGNLFVEESKARYDC